MGTKKLWRLSNCVWFYILIMVCCSGIPLPVHFVSRCCRLLFKDFTVAHIRLQLLRAMDVKHVGARTESDGTLHLSCGEKAASFHSPILQRMFEAPEEPDEPAGTKEQMGEASGGDAKAAGSQEVDLLTSQPWRRTLVTAARELIEAFNARADIDMEDCPVYEELMDMEHKATVEKDFDMERAADVVHAAQMFLFMCDTDF